MGMAQGSGGESNCSGIRRYAMSGIGFLAKICFAENPRKRGETNRVILLNKLLILLNSVFDKIAFFCQQN
jgi:hypothetical protein